MWFNFNVMYTLHNVKYALHIVVNTKINLSTDLQEYPGSSSRLVKSGMG